MNTVYSNKFNTLNNKYRKENKTHHNALEWFFKKNYINYENKVWWKWNFKIFALSRNIRILYLGSSLNIPDFLSWPDAHYESFKIKYKEINGKLCASGHYISVMYV
jgi:hypothetical protein